MQKGFTEAGRQAARRVWGQDAKERAPGRHPGKRLLQHADKQIALLELLHHEGGQRPVGPEIRTEQDATGLDSRDPQNVLEEAGWQVQNSDDLTRERQRRG